MQIQNIKFIIPLILLITKIISKPLLNQNQKLRNLNEKTEKQRQSGILLPIYSLPSKYGIGTLGKEAYKFVDFLVKAKQKNWQMLPLGPTENMGCPYYARSSYAGNPYLIDLEMLVEEKLLNLEEINNIFWGNDVNKVNYEILLKERIKILYKAYKKFKPNNDYNIFINENKNWLDDYSLFMSLKEYFNNTKWLQWPKDIRNREKNSIKKYTNLLIDKINLHKFIQYKFFEQFFKLKNYCQKKNIKLIGDVPIYVPMESVDVWTNPEIFQLDENLKPKFISGLPPDAFSEKGQKWGNPLYDWDKMQKNNYKWYIDRLESASKFFDVIKLDHFMGFEQYWSIPYGEETKNGKWVKGPGINLINEIKKKLFFVDFIVEDLGFLSKEVYELRKKSEFPGMNVLEFAFDDENSIYLPHNYIKNSVCYVGTHDNEILKKWCDDLSENSKKRIEKYFDLKKENDIRKVILRAGMSSVSYLFIAQMQDWLGCGGDARMNRPGIIDGNNWRWRAKEGDFSDDLAKEIGELTELYGR